MLTFAMSVRWEETLQDSYQSVPSEASPLLSAKASSNICLKGIQSSRPRFSKESPGIPLWHNSASNKIKANKNKIVRKLPCLK